MYTYYRFDPKPDSTTRQGSPMTIGKRLILTPTGQSVFFTWEDDG